MTIFFQSNKRKFSSITLLALLIQIFYPTATYALTGGPSQIEYENFEPAGATEMVNLATGDFVYNIPLLDVDGYPINISYHGGVGMEQESGWVGLGWSLNPGAINRGLRGLPDDFNGGENDKISESIHIKDNKTYGVKIGGGFEAIGFEAASLGPSAALGITYNNYKGLGLEVELGFAGSAQATNLSATGNLGIQVSSQDGVDYTMSSGIGAQVSLYLGVSGGLNRSQNVNSRRGLIADMVSGSASASASLFGGSYSKSTGSAINLVPNTAYVPNLQYSSHFSGITGELTIGAEYFWCNTNGRLSGYMFTQGVESPESKNAYGYLNLENADYNSALDFNRENDGLYNTENPKLPFSTLTYDVFNASAQGMNELFRPYRSDFGSIFDNSTTGGGEAHDVGLEANVGAYAAIGGNEYDVSSNSSSGIWTSGNIAYGTGVNFKTENKLDGNNNGRGMYEHAHFKALDELYIEDQQFYDAINKDELSSFKLLGGGPFAMLSNQITSNNGATAVNYLGQTKNTRQPRNSNMSYLNVSEASTYGFDKTIKNFSPNTFSFDASNNITETTNPSVNRNFGIANIGHHISEITILKEDGARYIYGLPLYNKTQQEYLFNCTGSNIINSQSIVNGYSSIDKSTNNARGKDNLYFEKKLPAYAHSYLLTGLLSKDYVDLKDDGITSDDLGDYTKFNYSRTNSSYKWRSPMTETANQAIYSPASYCEPDDDKAMFVFGSKEQWLVHSIETKNYVAEFYTLSKLDGKGASGVDGGISSIDEKKLDKIVLFAKTDLTTPIKTVHFDYDYSLCPSTPNSTSANKGKLTLKKIWFTYGKSDKGVFSPYQFKYADANHDGTMDANPSYDRLSMDRWGAYKMNSNLNPLQGLSNDNFPYTSQDSLKANINATSWNLTSVLTPAGSNIDIFYESDDYSYIQDQTPAQMLLLNGFSALPNQDPAVYSQSQFLYNTSSPYMPNNYMMVDLSQLKGGGIKAINSITASNILRNLMLPALGKIYFKAFVQIGSGSDTREFIPGYAEFNRGLSLISDHPDAKTDLGNGTFLYKKAIIKLNDVDLADPNNNAGDNCNPISKAGWQMARLYHPGIAYPGSEPGTNGLQALAGLFDAFNEVLTFKEKNNRLRKKGYSASINTSMSFVRLNIPTKTKIGGGHRVSKIEINDNWQNMVSSESSTSYGQTYNYSLPSTTGSYLSSGVASYEPLAGGDEISLRKPIEYSVERIAAPNDEHFSEDPAGETFYPQPTIIYSKITVRNLDRKDATNHLIASNIGRTEYEFFTSKDFPISSGYDGLQAINYNPGPDGNLFSNYQETDVHLSQGFILRLNNMHGKLKSVLSFQEGNNTPISGTKYTYKTTNNMGVLDNKVSTIDETGTITNNTLLGQHVESVGDFRRSNTTTFASSQSANLNISPLPFFIPLPIPLPSYFSGSSTEVRDFYSATLNKVVNQQGILLKVETISDYASSTSENLLWDSKTGDVVLSKTTTNYKNYDYSYATPAHWVYKGMAAAFENLGLGFKNVVTLSTGVINNSSGLLHSGDEVRLIATDGSNNQVGEYTERLWISKDQSTGVLSLINKDGNSCMTGGGTPNEFTVAGNGSIAQNYVLIVLRSGHKNILDESVEELTFSADPRSGTHINMQANVLDASVTEFSEDWQQYCPNFDNSVCDVTASINPYKLNTKGNWLGKRSYNYLGNRLSKDATTSAFNIRKDGVFETYKPFFSYFGNNWKPVYDPTRSDYNAAKPFDAWINNSEITKISPEGNVLEAKDALNRFSSSLYAYNKAFKTATAANAKYRDIGFDNFEDYDMGNWCVDNHFNFHSSYNKGLKMTDYSAHTGRACMPVMPNGHSPVTVKRFMESEIYGNYGSNNAGSISSENNCAFDFSPIRNSSIAQKYIMSVWIKEAMMNSNGDYTNSSVKVSLDGTTMINTLVKKSAIINGWQKFDYEFTIPANSSSNEIYFMLMNNTASVVLFDDIRVQPFNSEMNTYVYDPVSLRLWAELDGRNFATIYEYDNEGVLVRVKKETEKGIVTIKETRNSLKKQNN